MLVRFFFDLRTAGVPVSLTEFLSRLQALEARVASCSAEEFYWLARLALVKDERHFDRFDRVFAQHFEGAERLFEKIIAEVPADWLKQLAERVLSEEERRKIEALGSWDKLLETLRQRLAEQKERHEGGSKWIGTGGTSPFGSGGYNPEGVRIGDAGKATEEQFLGFDVHQRDVIMFTEQGDDLFGFAQPHQAMIDEHASELIADRFVNQHGGHSRIDPA